MKLYEIIRYNHKPWYIISQTDDTVTLLSKKIVAYKAFDEKDNIFSASEIHNYMNKKRFFSSKKAKAEQVGEARLLTVSEYEKIQEDNANVKLALSKEWWLQDPCQITNNYGSYVDKDGVVFYHCIIYSAGIRPVITVKKTAIKAFVREMKKQKKGQKMNNVADSQPEEKETTSAGQTNAQEMSDAASDATEKQCE